MAIFSNFLSSTNTGFTVLMDNEFVAFFPVPGCSFLHQLTGFTAIYESHMFEELPLDPKSRRIELDLGQLLDY